MTSVGSLLRLRRTRLRLALPKTGHRFCQGTSLGGPVINRNVPRPQSLSPRYPLKTEMDLSSRWSA